MRPHSLSFHAHGTRVTPALSDPGARCKVTAMSNVRFYGYFVFTGSEPGLT